MVVKDAVARWLPGVVGNADSAISESFSDGMLEAPHYTRPREYRGWEVTAVLLNGHHGKISDWRIEQSRVLTERVRPDLLEKPDDKD